MNIIKLRSGEEMESDESQRTLQTMRKNLCPEDPEDCPLYPDCILSRMKIAHNVYGVCRLIKLSEINPQNDE